MRVKSLLLSCLLGLPALAAPPRLLTNHLGYEATAPKRAVVQGGAEDAFTDFAVKTWPGGRVVYEGRAGKPAAVDGWRDWRFWTLDFTDLEAEGTYVVEARGGAATVTSFPFLLQKDLLERQTLSDVLYYFKAQRVSGDLLEADRHLPVPGGTGTADMHGGWYDASGDYGIHLSHLDFTNYFNPQQVPLVLVSLGRTLELLEGRADGNFAQIRRRLADELAYGADFLVRMHAGRGSFYEHVAAPGPGKRAEDRRLGRIAGGGFIVKTDASQSSADPREEAGGFDVSCRGGGGFSVAGLAMAAREGVGGELPREAYLKAAREAFAFLEAHNRELVMDRTENLLDDYAFLLAATELYRTTKEAPYLEAARRRAGSLMSRFDGYWRVDGKDRPFFHASDAGAPVFCLLDYLPLASGPEADRVRRTVRAALERELAITSEVPNPFGLARQYVQTASAGRRTTFFFPHDTETAPWWQGENARLASLAAAARLAVPVFGDDPAFQVRLQAYAADQLNWILGLNPFDASMLQGAGRNNPEYLYFGSWEYRSAPGGIVNGITSGYLDDRGIDYRVPAEVAGYDSDWRWSEQWLPHTSWYLLAAAAGRTQAPGPKAVIGYIFCPDRKIDPATVDPMKLTHINYAFANIKGGRMVEGFKYDAENFRTLNDLKKRNPALKVLVSVGGWGWSGRFSDMAATKASRAKFIRSALAFLERHRLDGLDIDWEYPGQIGNNNPFRPEDRENCTALVRELRAALDAAGRPLLLTMATGADDAWLEHTQMDQLGALLDYVNLMMYDQSEPTTGKLAAHHAPLFLHPGSPKALAAATVVEHYVRAGVPPAKLVLGIPFYGHAWDHVPARDFGLHQPGREPRPEIPASFRDIKEHLEGRDGFQRHWDDISKVPYLYSEPRGVFISYEDEESAALKARFVMDRGLAGIMFWEYWEDADGRLLKTVNRELGR